MRLPFGLFAKCNNCLGVTPFFAKTFFDPLLQKFHNQTKYVVVLTSYKCYIGSNFRNLEPNLVGDISVRCDKGTECPIGLICEKNTCTKPGPSSIHLVKGKHKYIIKFLKIDHTFDKLV